MVVFLQPSEELDDKGQDGDERLQAGVSARTSLESGSTCLENLYEGDRQVDICDVGQDQTGGEKTGQGEDGAGIGGPLEGEL